ncbi:MAG: hypothetical protein GY832_05120 [Chloroflexi bacterium]|nr:hypothetical protein [Chloroflexota bacterium]
MTNNRDYVYRTTLPCLTYLAFPDFITESAPRNPLYEEVDKELGDIGMLMALPWFDSEKIGETRWQEEQDF